eukprot:4130859-Amphidinium_carterae.1
MTTTGPVVPGTCLTGGYASRLVQQHLVIALQWQVQSKLRQHANQLRCSFSVTAFQRVEVLATHDRVGVWMEEFFFPAQVSPPACNKHAGCGVACFLPQRTTRDHTCLGVHVRCDHSVLLFGSQRAKNDACIYKAALASRTCAFQRLLTTKYHFKMCVVCPSTGMSEPSKLVAGQRHYSSMAAAS